MKVNKLTILFSCLTLYITVSYQKEIAENLLKLFLDVQIKCEKTNTAYNILKEDFKIHARSKKEVNKIKKYISKSKFSGSLKKAVKMIKTDIITFEENGDPYYKVNENNSKIIIKQFYKYKYKSTEFIKNLFEMYDKLWLDTYESIEQTIINSSVILRLANEDFIEEMEVLINILKTF
ncbi:hypothetical protein NGRA_2090 [Nosema granulosis]|uniref:Uncharacterized protein n=1 Tax=Nosema granulosis TaxID=83296 RepID=A0A9P6GYT3_9MICR|nr:hypothetical protein NGRA_2090 [Nosema granulosis]